MSRTPARFTQADVARAIRAAKQAGAAAVMVMPDGTIRIELQPKGCVALVSALALSLVSVMPGQADTEVFWLSGFSPIEITKVAVPYDVETFVQKAALDDQSFFAVDHFLETGQKNE